jgi:hypothetical protein
LKYRDFYSHRSIYILEFAWILSRTQVLSTEAQLRVDAAIDSFLDRSSLRTTELSPEQ